MVVVIDVLAVVVLVVEVAVVVEVLVGCFFVFAPKHSA